MHSAAYQANATPRAVNGAGIFALPDCNSMHRGIRSRNGGCGCTVERRNDCPEGGGLGHDANGNRVPKCAGETCVARFTQLGFDPLAVHCLPANPLIQC